MNSPTTKAVKAPGVSRAISDKVPLVYWRDALAEVSLLHPEVPDVSKPSKPIAIGGTEGVWTVTAAEPSVAECRVDCNSVCGQQSGDDPVPARHGPPDRVGKTKVLSKKRSTSTRA